MKKVCSNCHYIGQIIQPKYRTYKFLLSGFLIAFSTNYFLKLLYETSFIDNKPLLESITAFLFFPIVIFIAGIYLLYDDLKSKTPNKKSSLVFIILTVFMFVNGVLSLYDSLESYKDYKIPASIILVVFGYVGFYWYSRDWLMCSNCKKIRTMISIDKPEAQAIIKEHNLIIPDDPVEPIEEPKPKMPWQN